MERSVRVVHVEADREFAERTSEALERLDDGLVVESVSNVADGLKQLAATDADCVVSGYDLPGTTGVEFLTELRSEHPDLPFVLLTGREGEDVAAAVVNAGGSGYVRKDREDTFELLADRIDAVVTARRAGRSAVQDRLEARQQILDEMHRVLSEEGSTFEDRIDGLLEVGREVIDAEVAVFSHVTGGDYEIELMTGEATPFGEGDVVPLSLTHCNRTIEREGLVALERVGELPDAAEYLTYAELGYNCYIGTPVHQADSLYGTVCFHRRDERHGPFSAWQTTVVEILGQWASLLVEQRLSEERLVAERDRLDEFAARVSHDLRTPLSTAMGRVKIAQETGDVDQLGHAEGALEDAMVLIDDLLAIARDGEVARHLGPVAVAPLVTECWDALAPEEATLEVRTDRTVRADRDRLRQVFENLFRNAIEHGGPDVTVTVGEFEGGLYVADDGPGVPAEDLGRVTEQGYTSTETGTGFGLDIVSRVVEAHGWGLRMRESEQGGLRVDIVEREAERAGEAVPVDDPGGTGPDR